MHYRIKRTALKLGKEQQIYSNIVHKKMERRKEERKIEENKKIFYQMKFAIIFFCRKFLCILLRLIHWAAGLNLTE